MLSYRHIFHAGTFADVHKHIGLSLLLQALTQKPAPFCYVDAHAGSAFYHLSEHAAMLHAEYRTGIGRLWELSDPPALVRPYLDTVRAANPDGQLRYYPGSPALARRWLRPQDRLIALEQHPTDGQTLCQVFTHDPQVAVHQRDTYEGLRALLPPAEKRGLVLLDPSYEVKTEYRRVADCLQAIYPHWRHGIYAIWYPRLPGDPARVLRQALQNSGIHKILQAELWVQPDDHPLGLLGSGLLVINPPWRFEQQLQSLLPWLWQHLVPPGLGRWSLGWLVAEAASGVAR
jgi:23S rRNA (adenine2030-N6)-methyltransferase